MLLNQLGPKVLLWWLHRNWTSGQLDLHGIVGALKEQSVGLVFFFISCTCIPVHLSHYLNSGFSQNIKWYVDIFGIVLLLKHVGQSQRQNERISYKGLIINENRLEIKIKLGKLELRQVWPHTLLGLLCLPSFFWGLLSVPDSITQTPQSLIPSHCLDVLFKLRLSKVLLLSLALHQILFPSCFSASKPRSLSHKTIIWQNNRASLKRQI